MPDFVPLAALSDGDFAVIDMDTGAVLGVNLVVVPVSVDVAEWAGVMIYDEHAWRYGSDHGHALFAPGHVVKTCPTCGDPACDGSGG